MIRHILFITFNDDVLPGEIEVVRWFFLRIPMLVKGGARVEWDINDSAENKSSDHTHCVLMTFADDAARQYYLQHPVYQALKSIFYPALQDIVAFDFTLSPENSAESDSIN
ncbi:Dabb family protein [Salmonella enterica]|nr:Dabb family protein [Salmonella enterica]EBU4459538.1 Dabb family protein [Salmonella enterica]ECX7228045.1 Dabb family protein [Salmonella enterica]ECX8703906.1 Dabb family protein [Salmonella enterica]EGB2188576.1 Dabb family protein [Salmonella enterica]